jgi:hypothetical protein
MANPNKLFTTNAITREGIADEINQNCDRQALTADDDRLTDEVCTRFAAELGQTDEDDVADLCERYADELGLADSDEN